MELERAKGTRDFPPEDALLRQYILEILKKNFEIFGFNPIETPVLERFSILSAKYAGGSEILKETFKVEDQGGRDLGLRYDLTVPFSRFVAMHPNLKMPFKRYQYGPVFRDGPIKLGRYREFWQCDCDVVGTKSIAADAECIQLFLKCFEGLGLDVRVRVNNRKILDSLMEAYAVPEKIRSDVVLVLDKLEKKSKKEIIEELESLRLKKKDINSLLTVFIAKENETIIVESVIGSENEGLRELKELLILCNDPRVEFVPSLARGLSYYTGSIFEVFVPQSSIALSVASGGRYDKMIGDFLGSKQEYPAVGCSFGLDVIADIIKEKSLFAKRNVVKAYIIPIGLKAVDVWSLLSVLRAANIPSDIDIVGRGVSKNIDYADKNGIPYVIFVGSDELSKKKYKLRDLKTGKEKILSKEELIKQLQ